MKLLLDTHILLWALADDPKLPLAARRAILDLSNQLFFSAVSVWEVALKHGKQPDTLLVRGGEFAECCRRAGYYELPLRDRHVAALEMLGYPSGGTPHRDPFDHILIAQAKAEGMRFVTHDSSIAQYDEPCVWSV
jgi:PIN domain nuclease of toxin-antitoxin system